MSRALSTVSRAIKRSPRRSGEAGQASGTVVEVVTGTPSLDEPHILITDKGERYNTNTEEFVW